MYRFVAILLVLSLSQFASAQTETVSFGVGLEDAGLQSAGHMGGSADSVNDGPATGRVHWSGKAITITDGSIAEHGVVLLGTITRSNDPTLEGKSVRIDLFPGQGLVFVRVFLDPGQLDFSGTGRVALR